jgi:AbrB family looped-hinge helix DNA binding protein
MWDKAGYQDADEASVARASGRRSPHAPDALIILPTASPAAMSSGAWRFPKHRARYLRGLGLRAYCAANDVSSSRAMGAAAGLAGAEADPVVDRATCPVRCYLTPMRTTISTKGQIVLPAELRVADGIEAGEEFEVDRVGPDEYRLTRLTPPPNRGVVEWLRSCPDNGWFVEIESESTDSL